MTGRTRRAALAAGWAGMALAAATPGTALAEGGRAPVPAPPGDEAASLPCRAAKSSTRDFDVRALTVRRIPAGDFVVTGCLVTNRTDVAHMVPTIMLADREGAMIGVMGQQIPFKAMPGEAGSKAQCFGVQFRNAARSEADLNAQALLVLNWIDTGIVGARHAQQAWLPYRLEPASSATSECASGQIAVRSAQQSADEAALPAPSSPIVPQAPSLARCLAAKTPGRAIEVRDLRLRLIPSPRGREDYHTILVNSCGVSDDADAGRMRINIWLYAGSGEVVGSDGQEFAVSPIEGVGPLGAPASVAAFGATIYIPKRFDLGSLRPVAVVRAYGRRAEEFQVPFVLERDPRLTAPLRK